MLDPVWKLYAHAISAIGHTATLLEWDDRIPSFDEVHDEALKANQIRETAPATAPECSIPGPTWSSSSEPMAGAHLPAAHRAMANAATSGVMAASTECSRGEFIKPNDRLTSFERLEIYNRQYWFRLLDCLYDDYPGLLAVLGERKFLKFATAYLDDIPRIRLPCVILGARLEKFLREEPHWSAPARGTGPGYGAL